MKRSPLNRRGKKTVQWEHIRRELKVAFARVGITACEICLPQCWNNYALSFCHTKRRADCTVKDLERVVLGCAACATAFHGMNKHEEEAALEKIIAAREIQP